MAVRAREVEHKKTIAPPLTYLLIAALIRASIYASSTADGDVQLTLSWLLGRITVKGESCSNNIHLLSRDREGKSVRTVVSPWSGEDVVLRRRIAAGGWRSGDADLPLEPSSAPMRMEEDCHHVGRRDLVAAIEDAIGDIVVLVERQSIFQLQCAVHHLVGTVPPDSTIQHCAIQPRSVIPSGFTLLRLEE